MLWGLWLKLLPYLFILNLSVAPLRFPELNLENIFSLGRGLSARAEERTTTLLVTGDILPGRSVHLRYTQTGDPTFAFAKVADVLSAADLTLVNLEGPLVPDCPIIREGVTFCGDPRLAEGMKFAGIDIVNIANNHIFDFGAKGRQETITTLKEKGFAVAGEELATYQIVNGTRFTFLGFNTVGKKIDRLNLARSIGTVRESADVVVVQFHWGQEYTYVPKPAGEDPIALGHFAVEQGADLVIGNHSHWVQGIEFYNKSEVKIARFGEAEPSQGKLIVYSHGNFIFDQMWSQETREGVVGKYTFLGKKLVGIEFLPVLIDLPFQPRFLAGKEAETTLSKMRLSSERIRELVR
ncbi:MAG: CapA family protein, partial [candidate division WWE3 bacterium]|nr:CapA family protein [candidate division WWE3 bacterium]